MHKRKLILVLPLFVSLLLITACSITITTSGPPGAPPAETALPGATLPVTETAPTITTPIPAAAPTIAGQQPTAPPAAPTSNAPASVVAAIQNVILKANHEEEQAVASHNPAAMKDTATSSYYNQSVQNLNDMLSSGISAIKLANLTWGPITQQNSTTVQATTHETWATNFSDGSNLQETDTNVYTMVLQSGAWKVQQDEHPMSRTLQPPGNPGAPTPVAPVAPAGPGQSQSRNWAGYAATGGKFTAVSGTWTVPNVSSGATGIDATWVGIGGVDTHDLIQAGTQATVQSGQVTYSAWWETLPQSSQDVPMTISAGDSISVSIAQQKGGSWQIVIKDSTNAQTYQTNLTYASSESSADWVEEAPATGHRVILPLDNFGRVNFSGASTVENGKQVTLAQAHGQPITMYTPNQQALAQPSALGANGASFTVTRTSVPAPSLRPGRGGFLGSGIGP